MWLPGRLVYCAGNKGTVVPGLLKCLGVWPLPCAGGWSTLGSRPGGGTLLRNASSSIALCLGLGCPPPLPGWLYTEGCVVPRCPFTAAYARCLAGWCGVGELCCHPKRNPITGVRLCCQFYFKAWGCSAGEQYRALRHPSSGQRSPRRWQGLLCPPCCPVGARCLKKEGQEQAQHHSPRREKAASWYGAGDTKQILDFMHPFGAAPNPVLSPRRGQWLCLLTPFLRSWCLCSHPRGIQLLVPPWLHLGPQPPPLHW